MNGWGAPDASSGRQQVGGGGGFQNFNNGTAAWGQQNGGRGFDQARSAGGAGGGSGLEIEILNRTVPRIIGRGGSKIKELEEESGARIKIHKDRDNGTTTVVELLGSPDAQARARQLIESINSGGDSYRGRDQGFGGQGGYGGGGGGFGGSQGWGQGGGGGQSLEISVPSSSVGKIIGKGGSKIRELQDQSGARIKIHKDRDDGHNTIVELQGDRNAQNYAKQLVEQVVSDDSRGGGYGSQGFGGQREGGFGGGRGGYDEPGLEMFVPSSSVARVIGKGGSKIREFQEQSGCRIKIRKDRDDGVNTVVELIGAQSSQQHAKELIESFLDEGGSY